METHFALESTVEIRCFTTQLFKGKIANLFILDQFDVLCPTIRTTHVIMSKCPHEHGPKSPAQDNVRPD